IRAASNSAIRIQLLFQHARGDLDVELYGPNGNVVASSTSVTDNEQLVHRVPPGQAGLYFVRVFFDSNTYSLQVTLEEPGACGNGVIDPNEQCDGPNL